MSASSCDLTVDPSEGEGVRLRAELAGIQQAIGVVGATESGHAGEGPTMAAVGRLRAELGAQTANVAWLWTELQQMVWSNAGEQSWVENQSRAEQSAHHPHEDRIRPSCPHRFPMVSVPPHAHHYTRCPLR